MVLHRGPPGDFKFTSVHCRPHNPPKKNIVERMPRFVSQDNNWCRPQFYVRRILHDSIPPGMVAAEWMVCFERFYSNFCIKHRVSDASSTIIRTQTTQNKNNFKKRGRKRLLHKKGPKNFKKKTAESDLDLLISVLRSQKFLFIVKRESLTLDSRGAAWLARCNRPQRTTGPQAPPGSRCRQT